MSIIYKILVGALGLVLADYLLEGVVIESLYIAVISAIILGFLNLIVRPVLIFLTIPITLLTFGLFVFIINAALFSFAASFIEGFTVDSSVSALLGSLIVSITVTIGKRFAD